MRALVQYYLVIALVAGLVFLLWQSDRAPPAPEPTAPLHGASAPAGVPGKPGPDRDQAAGAGESPATAPPAPRDQADRDVTIAADPARARQQFVHFYLAKAANPDYAARKTQRGLPAPHHDFPEEVWIKAARAEVARHVTAPAGVTPIRIPVTGTPAPAIDGRIDPAEWSAAVPIESRQPAGETRVLLLSDGNWLYLACDAPADTTATGFDQFRFYYHVGLMPELDNERIHVRGGAGLQPATRANALRQTTIVIGLDPAATEADAWKTQPISDWYILDSAEGASGMTPHRQYEARLSLAEAGLHRGVPFASRVEVETDETRNTDGSFNRRNYLGDFGSPQDPVWLLITAD